MASPITGGSFLISDLTPADCFFPEDFTDEHRQVAQTAADFAVKEVLAASAQIEAKDFNVTRGLMRKAGELGLLAADVPEEYGGLEMDKVTSAIIADNVAHQGSFSVTIGAHTGIGTLPIAWYGTPAQKEKYLPRLASGEWIGAYALSEASSGSDAMNARTRAVLSPDGKHYILNGEKMWTTNGGFADIYTVFAKIDGEKFSAFIIERNTPGFTQGPEEHKLGIRGSSTCPLILNDCKVPAENLLGEIGKGHHIAFNILNIGRFKLAAAAVGGARASLANGIAYARDRKAFGKSISEFGLIQEKLAACAVGVFVGEAMSYRTVALIDAALGTIDKSAPDASLQIQKRIEEYAVECSILKVWASEMLDSVVDHIVQIYAGYGFVEEYPAERAYRDSRINRIFEGTNEINRLIITGWLIKRATTGQLALMPAIKKMMEEIFSGPITRESTGTPLDTEFALLANAKKIALFAAGAATERYGAKLADEQEVMAAIADMVIEVFAIESALLRAQKILSKKGTANIPIALARVYTANAFARIERSAQTALAAIAEGDTLQTQLTLLRRLTKRTPADTIHLQREIAKHILASGKYAL
jgi:alkylation response protein AidB-like acyl-CoA dehydrogenase